MGFAEDEGYDAYDIDDAYESGRGQEILTAEELGIDVVALVGTDKQVEWAESIRNEMLSNTIDYDEPFTREQEQCINTLRIIKSANWFIERRSVPIDKLIKELDKLKRFSALNGSDKQIAWAEQIRTSMITTLEQVYNERRREIEGKPRAKLRKKYKKVMTQLSRITYASWWIENRNMIDWTNTLEAGQVVYNNN
jgi:hypothetical protein